MPKKPKQPTVLVTISGPQGSGKSRIASRLAQGAHAIDGFNVELYEGGELVQELYRVPKEKQPKLVIRVKQES